jgi:hypothetical protein
VKQISGLASEGDTPRQKDRESKKDGKERKDKPSKDEERRKQSCELDPLRFPADDAKDEKRRERLRERNAATLISYCDMIFDAITSSLPKIPINLRCVFLYYYFLNDSLLV